MDNDDSDEDGPLAGSTAQPLYVHLDLAPADSPHCLRLSPVLIDALCDLGPALRHLDAGFADGAASNMYRVTELASLTSLSLRCLPGTQPDLASWDLQRLGTACTQLHTLRLALPPERMDEVVPGLALGRCVGAATASDRSCQSAASGRVAGGGKAAAAGAGAGGGGGGGFERLRVLELQAYVHTKEVVVGWRDLQPRLADLLTAQLLQQQQLGESQQHDTHAAAQCDGEDSSSRDDTGAVGTASEPRPLPPPLVPPLLQQRAVAAVREPLSTLAQLLHALPTPHEVQQALIDEAGWRDRRRQARQQTLMGQGMSEEEAEEAARREPAAATPSVPLWVVGQNLSPEQATVKTMLSGEDVGGEAAAWLLGRSGVAAAGEQAEAEPAELQRARAELVRACQPVAMELLQAQQLLALREVLLRQELVAGPVFSLATWTPRSLQRLRLDGFVGLRFGRRAGASGGGGGEAAVAASSAAWAPPSLREVDVILHGGPAAAEEALSGLRVWHQAAVSAAGGALLNVQSRCQRWDEGAL